jgi:uncharacterized protein
MSSSEAVIEAVKSEDIETLRSLLAKEPSLAARGVDGTSPVLTAVYCGKAGALEALLEAAPRLDIFEASASGDLARVRELLEGDPMHIHAVSDDGWTPLHLAAFFGHAPVVDLLLEHGPDLAAVSKNGMSVTPLQSALANQHEAVAEALMDHGADVNGGADRNWSPLHYAAHYDLPDTARRLLERGADPASVNNDGKTPLELARERGSAETMRLLNTVAGQEL